ncbi:MAG: pitrilysin family protein [Deferrisomatales bacterium]|nr:pitrilysin family protein [Deferrisomatales bacterium]
MIPGRRLGASTVLALAAAFGFLLETGSAGASPAPSLEGRVAERRLANGLTVLVLPRPASPTVSLQMTFRVGGVDEPAGQTGTAHLLEHMLFKGTRTLGTVDWKREEPLLARIEAVGRELDAERRRGRAADASRLEELAARLEELQRDHRPLVVKDEIDAIYARHGAVGFNASTSADLTSYTVSLPSDRLELWAAIEAARMGDPVLREYYVEREVVQEERAQRFGGDPGGRLYEALLSAAFAAHPYGNPVIGWPSDLAVLDIEDTHSFYRRYYGPDNCVIAAVGDVEPDGFFALVERYFGGIPARGVGRAHRTEEPPQTGPRRVEVTFDAEPRLAVGFHKPTLPERDDYVFDVIAGVLSDGRSSRLVRELVDRKRVAAAVRAVNGIPGARYPNLFAVFLTPLAHVTPEEAEEALLEELRRLAEEPPSPEEISRVVRRLEAARVRSLVSNAALARQLAYFQAVAGDWRYLEEHAAVLAGVTPEEVAAAARTYLTAANRTVAVLRGEGGGS